MNVLGLCAGVGGLELGVRLACHSATLVCAVEGEAFAAAILVARMQEGIVDEAPVWSDVRTFDGRPWRGVVDLITAGYPCQPFSFAGSRGGVDDPRHLWPHIARIIGEVEPAAVFLENVPGHLSLGFDQVCADLHGMGYRVAAGIFSAEEVGAPHRRERLFALAVADSGSAKHDGRGEKGARSSWVQHTTQRGEAVADADRGQRKQQRGSESCEWDGDDGLPRSYGGGDQMAWPPGPDDDWSRIPRRLWPALPQSELRRVADGLAPRLDRLRACGNGVVPLVSAYAFRTLAAEVMV